MCEVTDTCAEIELNNLVLKNNAHPCAMTPVCAILSETKRRFWSSGYRLPISMMRAKHDRYLTNKRKLRDKR